MRRSPAATDARAALARPSGPRHAAGGAHAALARPSGPRHAAGGARAAADRSGRRARTTRVGVACAACVALAGCGRGGGAASSAPSSSAPATSASAAAVPPSPEVEALWAAAQAGEEDDAMRLADREGSVGLVDGATTPERKRTAIRALAYVDDFEGLPFLASVVASGAPDEDATAAARAVTALAARRRRAIDPEDAASLRAGCDRLLAFARDAAKPRPLRVEVVRALRMLSDRGCPKASDIPNDVNAAASAR